MTVELFVICLAVGVGVGVMSAMFGVGGGVIMVPFIVFAFDQTQHVAEGTSLLVVVPTAVVGALAHRKKGFLEPRVAFPVALTGTLGAFLGVQLALLIDPEDLQLGFGLFTIVVAIRMVIPAIRRS